MNEAKRTPTPAIIALVALFVVGIAIVAAVHPDEPNRPRPFGLVAAGLLLGTTYGHVSVAAAWCALGPLRLATRLPLSAGWVAALCIALAVNLATDRGPPNELVVVLVFCGVLFGQWVLVQLAVWLWTYYVPRRLVVGDALSAASHRDNKQFGIREVLLLTTIVAVVLGSGRLALGALIPGSGAVAWRTILIFGFLAVLNAAMPLPIIATALTSKRKWSTACFALALVVGVTAIEVQIAHLLGWWTPMTDNIAQVGTMNAVQAAWLIAFILLARAAGCRLVAS